MGEGPACRLCGSRGSELLETVRSRPRGEVDYGIPAARYRREIRRCRTCDVYFSSHDLLGESFYQGAHNQATYGPRFLERFRRVQALPFEASDNKQRVARVADFLAGSCPGRPPGSIRVLDIGTGLCVFLAQLHGMGYRTVAVDPDPRAVEHARVHAGVDQAIEGSLDAVGRAERFDLIAFNKVLEHVLDPVAMLRSAAGLLAPGGHVYLELPDGTHAAAAGGLVDREEFYLEHHTVFTEPALRFLLGAAGLRAAELRAIHEPSDKYTLYAFARPGPAPQEKRSRKRRAERK